MKLTVVKMPKNVPFDDKNELLLREVGANLNEEFLNCSSWTDACSKILMDNITTLFLYNCFEYFLTRAYGVNYKIALNPVMILSYHPSCLSKNRRPLKLRHLFDIHYYLRHLKDHSDVIGNAMQLRFSAIAENHFLSNSERDQISPSP